MAICEIECGICGFTTKVTATKETKRKINIAMETSCPNVAKLIEELTEIDPYHDLLKRANDTVTFALASKYLPHPTCLVPNGILKAVEIESGFALPKDPVIKLSRS